MHHVYMSRVDVFVAYAGSDSIRADAVRTGARLIAERCSLNVLTWQDMLTTGNILIESIQSRIREANILIAEVSTLNPNVLFEVGYAISQGKRIWLLVDTTDEMAVRNWKTLGLLSGVGYSDYQNDSERLHSLFASELSSFGSREPVWKELTKSFNARPDSRSLFYLPTILRGDAPRYIDRTLAKRRTLAVHSADEDERGYAPLSYYAELIAKCAAALVYVLGPSRVRASMHNARASLLAGLACGLDRPTLMVAEKSFEAPIDYQDLLYSFDSAKSAGKKVDRWLDELPQNLSARPVGLQIAMGLPQRFGEYVAEYEADELAAYFVETAEYRRVLASGSAIFVGRKGTGKTATMLQAADRLASDRRNLVAVIKPSGYEFESLVAVLEKIPERDAVDYLLDGLWQYLLHCEIACAAVREAEGKPAGIATGSALDRLRAHLEVHGIGPEIDFAIRLERVMEELQTDSDELPKDIEGTRAFLNRKLHASLIRELRRLIGESLHERQRVVVLVDNLDKAWDRGANYERLSRVIFGLLAATGRVSGDFRRDKTWLRKVHVTLAVFLRADIFSMVIRHAREPDKIETLQIKWSDPRLLARVIEDRFSAGKEDAAGGVWTELFAPEVKGIPTRDYLLWRTLPRPRDLINLCNGAVMSAVNNRNVSVQEDDILAAEEGYSRFAFEALGVESDPDAGLGDLLYEFAGMNATLNPDQVRAVLSSAPSLNADEVISTLLRSSFLGLETAPEVFDYYSDEPAQRRNTVLAEKLTRDRVGQAARYRIHPAFRPFLLIEDDDLGVSEDRPTASEDTDRS